MHVLAHVCFVYTLKGRLYCLTVSESMAGFLAAEALAEQSVSDSTMHSALEAAQQRQQIINANKPNPRGEASIGCLLFLLSLRGLDARCEEA